MITHNRLEETKAVIESIRRFERIDVELCIADQGSTEENRVEFFNMADHFAIVTDREMWDCGFGYSRQKSINLATRTWVFYADPGEIWHENFLDGDGFVSAIEETHGKCPCFRVLRGYPGDITKILSKESSPDSLYDDNGRIFDKRLMKMAGIIHEAPFHKVLGTSWASYARKYPPVAYVEHDCGSADSPELGRRKKVLYEHLIHQLVINPQLRNGTNVHWWTTYWEKEIAPHFVEHSFEEWIALKG
jgi:hypothetical protein